MHLPCYYHYALVAVRNYLEALVPVAEQVADEAAVDAVLTASRTLVAVATTSLGAAADDITIAQYRALVVLASRGPQRMADLAAALDVAPSTAGRMCDRLVRKGLIRRHRVRADRRAVKVSITEAGRQVVDEATARRRAAAGRHLGQALGPPAVGGGRRAASVRSRGRGDPRQPVADGSGRSGAGVVRGDDVTASSHRRHRGAVTTGKAANGTRRRWR